MALRRYFGKISPLLINQLVGHEGEFVIDESTNNLYIMDGNTAGGHQVNLANLNIVKGNVYNNVIPISTNYYSLGNINYAWNSLYLNDSLYFNNTGYINQSENTLSIIANNNTGYSGLSLQEDTDVFLYGNNSVWVNSGNGPAYLSVYWQFNPYGILGFPDGTHQPTAFSNANISTLNNLASNTALIPGLVTNAAYQATAITSLATYANANSAAYFANNYSGNITAGNLTVSGNLFVTGNIITQNYETISKTEYANSIIASGNISASGNVGATYYTGNGYYLTGLQTSYSNTNVAAYLTNSIVTDINITGNISPTANAVYSLGTLTNQWKSLYVSNNTIYIAGTAIQVANGSLIVGGNTVSGGSTYSNSNVASYLPTSSVITSINANITAANSAIATLTSNAASQASDITTLYNNAATQASNLASIATNLSTLTSNAASQANDITTLYSNAATQANLITTIHANINAANSAIATLTSNAASQASDITTLYANAGLQANSISALNNSVVNLAGEVATIQAGSGFATTQQIQAANSSISTLNANLNAANLNITNLQSNSGTIASNVNTLFTNVAGLATNINTLFTNASSQASDINTLYSNAATQAIALNTLISNSATQENEISLLNANVSAANSVISGHTTNINTINANVSAANSAISTINANVSAANNAITSVTNRVTVVEGNIVSINNTLVGVINGAFSYGNANVASYLPTYSGALTAGNITASGNVGATFFTGNGYYLTGLATYGNTQVAAYLPTYSGNSNAVFFTGNGYYLTGITSGSTYSNSNVSAYYVANTVAASNVQILNNGNIRLPTGGVINESQGTGTITLVPNTTASATAGVVIGGSGYLLAANGSRNATLNYGSVSGQFGIYQLNVYGNQQNAIVNGGTSNVGNIGSISTFFGNAFVSNIYSQNYYYPNGTSILSGIGGTYGNTQVGYYLNSNLISSTISLTGNVIANAHYGNSYLYSNGVSILSGISGTYGNTQVATYLPTYTGNIGAGNVNVTANVNAANINVTGNLTYGNVSTSGNVTASYLITTGSGGNITGANYVIASNFVITNYGNISGANVITANTFIGTSATISGNLYSPSQTGKSAAIVAQNTAVTMDNIKVQWLNNGSGNANQLQIGSVSGTPSILYTYVFEAGTGGTPSGGSSSTSLSTTYANIGNPSGTACDLYMVTATVGTNAYRVSAMTGSSYSNNLISIERLV